MNWRPQSLSELTPIVFSMELTYLDSEVSNYSELFHMHSQISKEKVQFHNLHILIFFPLIINIRLINFFNY